MTATCSAPTTALCPRTDTTTRCFSCSPLSWMGSVSVILPATPLEVEPAIYVRGLPTDIDLTKMPHEGWSLTIQASTVEEIGTLEASLVLRRSDTSEIVREAFLNFSIDVPEHGSQTALLRVDGLDQLRPGEYEGQLNLSAFNPAGLPMEVQVRPAPSLPVALDIPRSAARIQVQEADFGELLFDTIPEFPAGRGDPAARLL